MRTLFFVLSLILFTGCAAGKPAPAPREAAPAMPTPEELAKLSLPGEFHAKLAPLAGKWKYMLQWWMDPKGEPLVMKGTNINRWILGKRFLMQEVKGRHHKEPFEGLGILGYDNVRGQYSSVWLDSMGTGIMTGTGSFSPADNSIHERGSMSCPMTKSEMHFRAVLKILDANRYSYEMYGTGPDGQEFRSAHIEYVRIN